MFWTSFSLLTKDANFKQIEGCAVFWRQFRATGLLRTVFLDKCLLVKKRRQLQEKRQLRRVFWRQFEETGQFRPVYWTSYRLLTKDAKFKQIDRCADCFDANLEQQDSCARCFWQDLASSQKSLISSKTTVARSVLTPISSNWTGAHGVLDNFQILTEVANLKQNESCAECFDVNFDKLDSCTRCLCQA